MTFKEARAVKALQLICAAEEPGHSQSFFYKQKLEGDVCDYVLILEQMEESWDVSLTRLNKEAIWPSIPENVI